MKYTILALDPGETTGVAVCTVDEHMDTLEVVAHKVISKWRAIDSLITEYCPNVIVAEQYRLYPQLAAAQAFSTIVAARVLGAIELIAELRGIPLIEQAANVAASVRVPERVYKDVRYYRTPHEKDAVKHAVAYCFSIGVKE